MSQHLEIEFKNLLTESEYNRLIQRFHLSSEAFFSQTNHYFDTPDFQLKANHSALRIREKNGQFELTLKQPTADNIGLLETNQIIDVATANILLSTGKMPAGIVAHRLSTTAQLVCFGSLKTTRAEMNYKNGLLVFDKSEYAGRVDYELEYEAEDYEIGKAIFKEFLQSENIPARETQNKVERLYYRILSNLGR